jgi:ParB family chromosome partitioning protein
MMSQSIRKLVLSSSRDIPFNKLVLSQSNVRRIKAGVSIEELAEDIARRTLLQSLTVRPVVDADGAETGMFEIPAGGRRYRALELLVKQKRLARTAPIPCVIRTDGIAEEDSLAENIQRAPLHPLDQFRAFLALREKGLGEEEIAAAFFVTAQVVRQRLKLASISPKLLEVYAEDGMTLDQLMAFTVNTDHARQEQVWEGLQRSYSKEPYQIRRLLTEGAVRASDKRVHFVGVEAYEEAGGAVLRDLFQHDDGGWLQDAGLLLRLVAEKLEHEAETIRAEGWRWIEVAIDFPYGHTYGLRRLVGEQMPLMAEDQATQETLRVEVEHLEQAYAEADEVPEEVDRRLSEIETARAVFEDRPVVFDEADRSRAGAFVSIDGSGVLRVERGFVRPEDDAPVEPDAPEQNIEAGAAAIPASSEQDSVVRGEPEAGANPEEGEDLKPLPDRLTTELTAHRTLALRHALGGDVDTAFLAALHVLCLKLFYRYGSDSCLEIDVKSVAFGQQAPGLNDSALAKAIDERHRAWAEQLPRETEELWDALVAFDSDSRQALFAHCVALSLNAIAEPWNKRPRALAHADWIAAAVGLDMVASGWTPTVDNYLGRVTKARILQAVREAKGEGQAQLIGHLKKGEMAEKAQELLADSGWLPEPLRTRGHGLSAATGEIEHGAGDPGAPEDGEQWATIGGESAIDLPHDQTESAGASDPAHAAAAE